jgi:hypothetical protein
MESHHDAGMGEEITRRLWLYCDSIMDSKWYDYGARREGETMKRAAQIMFRQGQMDAQAMGTRAPRETTFGVAVFVALALITVAAIVWAQEVVSFPAGDFCWRMMPFDDTIKIQTEMFNIPDDAPAHFVLSTHWAGLTTYAMEGGGQATFNRLGRVFSLDILLQNKTTFFAAQPICHLKIMTEPNLNGSWAVDCVGERPVGQAPKKPPFLVEGTALPIVCAPDISIPEPQVSVQGFALTPAGMLAGSAAQ